ncbi:hypothetical protein [Burkholderia multivorans]|nr:hypothetical protein [Burkholderia multivorans]KGC03651.1 hypothetical protein DM81_3325 [Burkholderia multivorans]MDN7607197.1 hypothetical protein [Burkholderia multivorans]
MRMIIIYKTDYPTVAGGAMRALPVLRWETLIEIASEIVVARGT